MKRYKIITDFGGTKNGMPYEEDSNGRWVEWDDVKGVEGQVLESIELECNCKEMFDKHACNWICPAHGYKKR